MEEGTVVYFKSLVSG